MLSDSLLVALLQKDMPKADFAEYENTHHFLPARGDNVVPNTLHVILHLQIWICFILSVYLLVKHFYGG